MPGNRVGRGGFEPPKAEPADLQSGNSHDVWVRLVPLIPPEQGLFAPVLRLMSASTGAYRQVRLHNVCSPCPTGRAGRARATLRRLVEAAEEWDESSNATAVPVVPLAMHVAELRLFDEADLRLDARDVQSRCQLRQPGPTATAVPIAKVDMAVKIGLRTSEKAPPVTRSVASSGSTPIRQDEFELRGEFGGRRCRHRRKPQRTEPSATVVSGGGRHPGDDAGADQGFCGSLLRVPARTRLRGRMSASIAATSSTRTLRAGTTARDRGTPGSIGGCVPAVG